MGALRAGPLIGSRGSFVLSTRPISEMSARNAAVFFFPRQRHARLQQRNCKKQDRRENARGWPSPPDDEARQHAGRAELINFSELANEPLLRDS
ncbi:hypothetical protein AVEN_22613-1 [Araneus ventricosus]|uniref:Uncharacterized protein n=1 Tax=Araneus ventricosus TaxID=182803 RepID=A0A4Y2LNF7_ARAVE|nr:hypothetical protein AVEN_89884-1 [Araneus ventricosus]GBN15993.1 hypothetical protein AVEN_234062-1 [Araneus ventricosus]GBO14361.1 hypothetical protein AVEN_78839-1 [Araneus ventricosus]GBO14517.1 hypothetical protein AVEN_22613-1 [Araneus ventricosus]